MTEKTLKELEDEIYVLLADFFGEDINSTSHLVGREFSEDDLDRCISYYFEYTCK